MRVTENVRAIHALAAATQTASRLERASRAASSGKRVEVPADDPNGYATMLNADGRLRQLAARGEVLDKTAGDLELADNILASASDTIVRAREIATQMANGTMNASDRQLAADEVRALRENLRGLANARGSSGYLFAGTKTDTPPIDAAGVYQGNTETLEIEVGDGVVSDASADGAGAFTVAGGKDAFIELDKLAAALDADDVATVRSSLDTMDTVDQQITRARSDAGSKIERFRSASAFVGNLKLAVTKTKADAVEIDAAAAYTELAQAQAAYERSLQVTQKILSLSAFKDY